MYFSRSHILSRNFIRYAQTAHTFHLSISKCTAKRPTCLRTVYGAHGIRLKIVKQTHEIGQRNGWIEITNIK